MIFSSATSSLLSPAVFYPRKQRVGGRWVVHRMTNTNGQLLSRISAESRQREGSDESFPLNGRIPYGLFT